MRYLPPAEGGELLSHDDERAVLMEAIVERLPERGSLFMPSAMFYDQLETEAGIATSIRDLYRWLGTKPPQIKIEMTNSATLSQNNHVFSIPRGSIYSPYQLAASLTIIILDNLLTERVKNTVSASLVETASIEAGFGALILNGAVASKTSFLPPLKSRKHLPLHALSVYSASSYAAAFAEYCHQTKQDSPGVMAQLTKEAGALMPGYYTRHVNSYREKPRVVRSQASQQAKLFVKVAGVGGILGVVCGLGIFIYSQRTYTPTQAIRTQYQKSQSLAKAHTECTEKAQKLQNAYSQDDIFQERQINTTLTECQSLRNQYNYEVNIYNSLISTDD